MYSMQLSAAVFPLVVIINEFLLIELSSLLLLLLLSVLSVFLPLLASLRPCLSATTLCHSPESLLV